MTWKNKGNQNQPICLSNTVSRVSAWLNVYYQRPSVKECWHQWRQWWNLYQSNFKFKVVQTCARTRTPKFARTAKKKKSLPSQSNPLDKKRERKKKGDISFLTLFWVSSLTPPSGHCQLEHQDDSALFLPTCVCHYCIFCVWQQKRGGGEARGVIMEGLRTRLFFTTSVQVSVSVMAAFLFPNFLDFYIACHRGFSRKKVHIHRPGLKAEQHADHTDTAQMHSTMLSSHSWESANRMWGRSLLSSSNGNQLSRGGTYPTASYWTFFYNLEFKSEGFKLSLICKGILNIILQCEWRFNEKIKCLLHLLDQTVELFVGVMSRFNKTFYFSIDKFSRHYANI